MKLGIIGGSGLENPSTERIMNSNSRGAQEPKSKVLDIIKDAKETTVNTPYGLPSSSIITGTISGIEVLILSRHGKKHELSPSQVNYRANIAALQKLGCTHILATTACGSLREEIKRGDFVILDSFIDFTKHRKNTFHESFENGVVHQSMSDPFSQFLREKLIESCSALNFPFHPKGTVITIEGPRFSTRAESKMYRILGADVVNMSVATEAALANEAGIKYAVIAMSTDYDCWKTDEEPVNWDGILEIFNKNVEKVTKLLLETINQIATDEKIQIEFIKSKIRTVPNWPKQGIMFRDITTLIKDRAGFETLLNILEKRYKDKDIDVIAGVESRGFIIGAALASRLKKGFVLIRKPGKLPADTIKEEYELEYGKDSVEIHKDAIKFGEKVLLVDDLIASGGTAAAAGKLIERLGGTVVECAFIVELPELKGRDKISWPIYRVLDFEGE